MKRIPALSALALATAFSTACLGALFSTTAMAGQQNDAVVGAVVGGGAGALIGHSVNGREGALIGSAIGAITGVAMATSNRERVETRTVVYAERPVVRERVVVYQPEPVIVHRYYEPRRVVVVERRGGHGRGYGHGNDWKRDYAYDDNGHERGDDRYADRDDERGANRDDGRDSSRDDGRGRWH
jgi:hypothetical protein